MLDVCVRDQFDVSGYVQGGVTGGACQVKRQWIWIRKFQIIVIGRSENPYWNDNGLDGCCRYQGVCFSKNSDSDRLPSTGGVEDVVLKGVVSTDQGVVASLGDHERLRTVLIQDETPVVSVTY